MRKLDGEPLEKIRLMTERKIDLSLELQVITAELQLEVRRAQKVCGAPADALPDPDTGKWKRMIGRGPDGQPAFEVIEDVTGESATDVIGRTPR